MRWRRLLRQPNGLSMLYRFLIRSLSLPLIFFFLALTAVAVSFLPRFSVEVGTDSLLDEHDPDLEYYIRTRSEWGSDEYVIACITRENWFDADGVQTLLGFAGEL